MKPLVDILNESRENKKVPMGPVTQQLKEIFIKSERLAKTLRDTCVSQNGSGS